MDIEVAKVLGGSFITGCFLLFLGLMVGGDGGQDYSSMKALGQEIGRGLAQAACIESGGRWRSYGCEGATP